VFERVSGIAHERLTGRLIRDPDSEVHRILFGHERVLPEKVAAFLSGGGTVFHDVIASQLDADRFDYLLRDNYMTGSRYGAFDLEWLLHHLTVAQQGGQGGRMAVSAKGISAVEDYLHARYNMYRNVYFHKVVRSAEGMVRLALRRAKRLAVQDRLDWPGRESSVYKALLGQRLTIEEFWDLDDVAVNQCFKTWARGDDAVLARLCRGLLYRRLYKTIDVSHLDEAHAPEAFDRAKRAVVDAGGDAEYDLFDDQPADTPYEAYEDGDPSATAGILVQSPTGDLTPLTRMSPLPAALNQRLMFRRIHVTAEYREVAARAI
jgi:HD superfamily phosphohydrolase